MENKCMCDVCTHFCEAEYDPQYSFSVSSMNKLKTCHPDLQRLALEVVKQYDCTVVCGHRPEYEQNLAVAQGNSKVNYPNSTHNETPSTGIDLAPYIAGEGISWDSRQCYYFAGYVLRTAEVLGIKIRWGGDWDGDRDIKDQSFNDLVHFELIK
jgi:peptidoglycan LD-endopeptidase CwlK